MIVVSDTTPLRYLAVLGQMELLPRLFGRVHCPSAVIQECRHPRAPSALRTWAEQPSEWLSVVEVPVVAADLRDYPATIERLKTETNFRATQAVIDSAWAASTSR